MAQFSEVLQSFPIEIQEQILDFTRFKSRGFPRFLNCAPNKADTSLIWVEQQLREKLFPKLMELLKLNDNVSSSNNSQTTMELLRDFSGLKNDFPRVKLCLRVAGEVKFFIELLPRRASQDSTEKPSSFPQQQESPFYLRRIEQMKQWLYRIAYPEVPFLHFLSPFGDYSTVNGIADEIIQSILHHLRQPTLVERGRGSQGRAVPWGKAVEQLFSRSPTEPEDRRS